MTTKSDSSEIRVLAGAFDDQQARLVSILARHAGEPVTYDELRAAGIEYPASLVSEIELAGVEVDRCFSVREGQRVTAVRLPAGAGAVAGVAQTAAPWPHREVALRPESEDAGVRSANPPRRRPGNRLLAPLALLAAGAITVVVAVATTSGSPSAARHSRRTATTAATAARPKAPLAAVRPRAHRSKRPTAPRASANTTRSTGSTGSRAATGSPAATRATVPSSAPSLAAPASNTSSGANQPGAAVEGFYEAAAQHRYPAAWALADSNMRAEVGGYAAFENQMSSVRAISFHELDTVERTATSATIAVRTTSVQSNRVQQCSGTVRTVQQAGAWVLDGISIHCV